ncbi:DUF349 domain-containing protein [Flaviflexus huanghaiensis]|uniref:DUF349 domain-containing protein n=1 Tax=Flaviflexus huanghaiensis TaxID=1111473 RepID=UPI0015FD4ABB|nr:DUF349 domain-containing protein [Flaviflexus huanghaiensis]
MTQSTQGHEPTENEDPRVPDLPEEGSETPASDAPLVSPGPNTQTPVPTDPVEGTAVPPSEPTPADPTEEPSAPPETESQPERADEPAPETTSAEDLLTDTPAPDPVAAVSDPGRSGDGQTSDAEISTEATVDDVATDAPATVASDTGDVPAAEKTDEPDVEGAESQSPKSEQAQRALSPSHPKPALGAAQEKHALGAAQNRQALESGAGQAVPHGTTPAPGRPTPKPPKGGPKAPPLPKKPASKPAVVPPAPPVDPKAASEAAAWGRVDDEGNVYLRASGDEGERLVGQYAIGDSKDDALSVFVRRYLDLVAQVALLESRLEFVNPQEIVPALKSLEESLVEPAVVGDVAALRTRTEAVRERLKVRQAEFEEERRVAKLQALAERTALIERAETIAAQDPAKTHWRDSRNELNSLLDQWKAAQKSGPRIDRSSEESLWKRFSRARTEFDRHRRQHFSQVEANRNEVTAKKEALIKRAEEMSTSTNWGATSAAYRDLLEEWKAAGRITRKEDDKLWARFRAAQQVFFDARQADRDSISSEQNANLQAKLELIKEAESILPIKDIQAAKAKLHDIQDRWEDIGFVPRKDMSRTEGRLRDIESAVRSAEDEQWRRSDPSKVERASGFAAQLEEAIAKHEAELEDAKARGDEQAAARAQEALDARRAWLDQLK